MKVLALCTCVFALPGAVVGLAQFRSGFGQFAAAGVGRGGSQDDTDAGNGFSGVLRRPSGRGRAHSHSHHHAGNKETSTPPPDDKNDGDHRDHAFDITHVNQGVRRRPYLSALIGTILAFFGFMAFCCVKLALEYRATKRYQWGKSESAECDKDWSFIAYLRYRLSQWFTWTESASAKMLIGIFFLFVAFGGITYCLILDTNAPIALYKIIVWLVSPDGGIGEHTFEGRIIGVVMSLGGLLIFALVLTLVQDSFTAYLEGIKEGCYAVMECNHTVIIGLTASTVLLVQELCSANEHTGGITIVILAEQPKPEVEVAIKTAGIDFKGSRVVVRSGTLHEPVCLKQVAVHTCSTAIILPDEDLSRELRDASVLRVLIALRGQGWPRRGGQIVVICSLVRNGQLFRQTGGLNTHVMMIDGFVAKLMVQCSRGYGLGMAVISMLGFQGSEFYISRAADHLVGKTLSQASLHFPGAVIAGVSPDAETNSRLVAKDRSGPLDEISSTISSQAFLESPRKPRFELCPGADRKIAAGDELVLFAATYRDTNAQPQPCTDFPQIQASPARSFQLMQGITVRRRETAKKHKELVMIMGWNERVGMMLLELDRVLPSDSSVIILAQEDLESRTQFLEVVQRRWNRKLLNITIEHHIGTLGSRYQLERLQPPVSNASRIFVLYDNATISSKCSDAIMITTVLQIREVIRKQCGFEKDISIVPEIGDSNAKHMCEYVNIYDYISSVDLHAQVLATVSSQPQLAEVLDAIISEGGKLEFRMRSLDDYVDPLPAEVCFYQVIKAVQECGDVCFGWTQSNPEGRQIIDLNPAEKQKFRAWSAKNKILVLGDPTSSE